MVRRSLKSTPIRHVAGGKRSLVVEPGRLGFDSWLQQLPRCATCRVSWPSRSHHHPAPAVSCTPAREFPWMAPRAGPCLQTGRLSTRTQVTQLAMGVRPRFIRSWRPGFSLRKRSCAKINPHQIKNILLYPEEGKPSKKRTVISIFTYNYEVWDLLQNNPFGAGVDGTGLNESTVLEAGLVGARVSIILFSPLANIWTSS